MKNIWVVDDDEGILEAADVVLTDAGYAVSTYIDSSCFQGPGTDLPDLILLDILLSGEDGRNICKQLKSLDSTKHIPIILISAHSSAGRVKDLFGADDFLIKPFDINELFTLLEKYLKVSS